ncbi:MAG: hypothetical protein AAF789_10690 [Bacteroidota bacterium]
MTPANDFFNKLAGPTGKAIWQNKLDGQWQDKWGWNIITQPDFGNPAEEDFHTRIDPMRETITFKKIGSAQNIGISGEAGFWQSMSYEIDIRNPRLNDPQNPDGKGIHHEMGHFLIKVDSLVDDANAIPHERGRMDFGQNISGVIIRQATIPRANSFMTHGKLDVGSVSEVLGLGNIDDFYSSRTHTTRQFLQDRINTQLASKQQEAGAPDLTRLVTFLQTTDESFLGEKKPSTEDWEFAFRLDETPSQMASGQRVTRPVGIGNLLSDFWIGDRVIDGVEKEFIQYSQKVNILFNGEDWPHVAVNTLIKQ